MPMPHRRAFTLIELLVVISIIALLIALLLPALKSARDTARSAVCLANQRQILIAQHTYASDNGYYLAPGKWNGYSAPNNGWVHTFLWDRGDGYLGQSYGNSSGTLPASIVCPSSPVAADHIGRTLSGNSANPNFTYHANRYFPGYLPLGAVSGNMAAGDNTFRRLSEHPPGTAFYIEKADEKLGYNSEEHMRLRRDSQQWVPGRLQSGFLAIRHGQAGQQDVGGYIIPTGTQNVGFLDGSASALTAEHLARTRLDSGGWNWHQNLR